MSVLHHSVMASKRKGAPAAAAAGARKSLRGGGRSSAGGEPLDEAADKRLAADVKKAEDESRRDSYVRVASTEGLWAWGADHDGWALPRSATRDEVINTLMERRALPVGSTAALNKCWRTHCGGSSREFPPADEEEDPPEEGAQPEVKNAIKAVAPAAASSAAAAAASSSPASTVPESLGPMRSCSLCGGCQHSVTEKFKCNGCGMNNALPFSDEMNVYLRAIKSGAPAPPPGGNATTISGQSITTSKASKRDEEFKRLAQEGDPYPLFEEKGPFTAEQAFALGRNAFLATDYAPASAWLKALASSGKLTQPAVAIPIPLSQVAREREQHGDAMLILRDGRLTQSNALEVAPLKSMSDLMMAFAGVIGPALIQQPAALSNWFAMLVSTVMVEKDSNSWPAARKFIHDTLTDSVNRRVPFNAYDTRIVDAVTRWARTQSAPPAHHLQAACAAAGGRSAPPGQADARAECCKDWNFGRCARSQCNRVHECMWLACTATDKKHQGKECAQRPPPRGAAAGARNDGGGGKAPPPKRS